jgi:hypothetical protein
MKPKELTLRSLILGALPGPLFLQGDHGPVEYRNIVITPAR